MADILVFERILYQLTFKWEGGYVYDTNDPGGETKYGISKRSYPDVDIANLTQSDASLLYEDDYWNRARCSRLPPYIAVLVFDGAVNTGVRNAVKALQRAVDATEDGVIGPKTIRSIKNAERNKGDHIVLRDLVAARANYYALLDELDDLYAYGWFRRLMDGFYLSLDYLGDVDYDDFR